MSTVVSLICLGPPFQKMTHHFLLHESLLPTNLEKNLKLCLRGLCSFLKFQDYVYDSLHTAAISVYLSCCKHPEEKDLLLLWQQNKKSLIALLQEVSSCSTKNSEIFARILFSRTALKGIFATLTICDEGMIYLYQ